VPSIPYKPEEEQDIQDFRGGVEKVFLTAKNAKDCAKDAKTNH
jgi:hypothetical protein